MNKNNKRKEKSKKLFYSTVAAYGLTAVGATQDTVEAADVDTSNNQENKEAQTQQAPTAQEAAATSEAQSVEVVDAKEYLGQVAGEAGLKHAGAPEDSAINQALN